MAVGIGKAAQLKHHFYVGDKYYKAGPNKKVEGRNGMVYVEEDWVDEEITSHREWDE